MTRKYKIDRAREQFNEQQKLYEAQLSMAKDGKLKFMDPDNKDKAIGWLSSELPALKDFERRGFRFGTPADSWKALHSIAQSIESGHAIDPIAGIWLLTALNNLKDEDPKDLMRELGFIEMGRARQFNKFDISDRMAHLIEKEGMTKAEAARTCSAEFGAHTETCLMWYRRRAEIFGTIK